MTYMIILLRYLKTMTKLFQSLRNYFISKLFECSLSLQISNRSLAIETFQIDFIVITKIINILYT